MENFNPPPIFSEQIRQQLTMSVLDSCQQHAEMWGALVIPIWAPSLNKAGIPHAFIQPRMGLQADNLQFQLLAAKQLVTTLNTVTELLGRQMADAQEALVNLDRLIAEKRKTLES